MRFLVVDDEELIRRSLRNYLAPYGEVVAAATAQDARRLLASQNEWSAFFIDLRLPDGSGIEVLAHARAGHPATPAMLLTGCLDSDAINAAFDLDAVYVLKPIVRRRLEQFLATHAGFATRLRHVLGDWQSRFGLSKAEIDILERAASGDERETIACARRCSALTIKTHVKNILSKVGETSLHACVGRLLREVAG